MDYELCLELKEAGFPQKPWTKEDNSFLARENGDGQEGLYDPVNDRTMLLRYFSDEYLEEMDKRGLIVYIPTLSELVAACGADFDLLHMTPHIGSWAAHGQDGESFGAGPTPEVACAKLYLALKKK